MTQEWFRAGRKDRCVFRPDRGALHCLVNMGGSPERVPQDAALWWEE